MKNNENVTPSYSGKRVAIAIIAWLPASLAVLYSITMSIASLSQIKVIESNYFNLILLSAPMLAWYSLALMTLRWIQDRPCHRIWPVLGSLSGAIAAVTYIYALPFYGLAMMLAGYLAYWHGYAYPRRVVTRSVTSE